MADHLLLLATTTGYQTRMFREAALKLGLDVTLASDRCKHLEDPWGDNAIPVRFEDPAGSLETIQTASAERGPFTAIAAVGDRTTFLAALAGQAFGIEFHPPYAVDAANNKHFARQYFQTAGLPQPEGRLWETGSDAAKAAKGTRFPCVLKPLGLSGSRGVIRANNSEEFVWAFQQISAILAEPELARRSDSRNQFIRVEDYISGEEFALEGIVTKGEFAPIALFDKPDALIGPYFEETIYVTPSRHAAGVQQDVVDTIRRGVAALGLRHGPIHAEARHNHEGTWILEIAPRPIGGYCARAMQFANGWTLEELILRHACREALPDLRLATPATGMMMIPIPKAGIYRGVAGVEEARGVPGITDVLLSAVDGQRVKVYPEASGYLGFLFAAGAEPLFVEQSLREAHAKLRFDIATVLA
ncbi:MAG: ATP-grasp domain-containing protein [Acidobacteria bacterium]|nr:ATP-grasp domain-containing protein [Acidobacteriota bacterium]